MLALKNMIGKWVNGQMNALEQFLGHSHNFRIQEIGTMDSQILTDKNTNKAETYRRNSKVCP